MGAPLKRSRHGTNFSYYRKLPPDNGQTLFVTLNIIVTLYSAS